MASAAERFHIVISPDERRAWNAGAAKLGLPTAEYVRRAVASFETGLTPAEMEQLSTLAGEVQESAARIHAMIDGASVAIDRPIDEEAMRMRAAARLADDSVVINSALLDFSTSPVAARAA
jgi:hypothetical protein